MIEELDWRDAVEKYDGAETVFYGDPPYIGTEEYYPEHDVDHEALLDVLDDVEGHWLLSLEELQRPPIPAGFHDPKD